MTLKNLTTILIISCFILNSFFIALVYADQCVPTWLREGTYVRYTTNQPGYAYFFNSSNPRGYDTLGFYNATFGWSCLSITNKIAKIEFFFDYMGKTLNNVSLGNATLTLKSDVFVDLDNRAVHYSNGSIIGTTHLWVCANPNDDQKVVIWDIPPEKVSLPVKTGYILDTCQGMVKGFIVEGTVTINQTRKNIDLLCDSTTGLMVDGSFDSDPIMVGSGINVLFINGRVYLSDTNIEFAIYNETSNQTNVSNIVMFMLLPIIVFVALFVAIRKRMQKKD